MTVETEQQPELKWLPVDVLVPNAENPNEQDERTFNATVASIEEEGWVQPCASVVPLDNGQTFEIVAGHHRWEAARVLGHESVPCWVLDPAKFDKDRRDWNVVKMNMIAGQLNPQKFARLYERMVEQYDKETLQALMGFTSDDAFRRVYKGVTDALPDELKDALNDVKDEIRTIDDLSLVLNRLFREHGETLPSNMMAFSWGGKEVLWIRADDELWARLMQIADGVKESKGDMVAEMKRLLIGEKEPVA